MTRGREVRRHFALAALLVAPLVFVFATMGPAADPASRPPTPAPTVAASRVALPGATPPAGPLPSPAPAPSRAFEFVKPDEVAIEGTVVAPDGTPVEDAQILVQLDVTRPMPREIRAFTAADGRFRVAVPPGRPVVLRVVTPTSPPQGFRHPVERVQLPAGGTKDLIVRLRGGASLFGRVVDGNGVGVPGLRLRTAVPRAMSSGAYVPAESVTSADGSFAFHSLAMGLVTIIEDRPRGVPADHHLIGAADVRAGSQHFWKVPRLPAREVQGRVTDAAGRPVAARTVVLARVYGREYGAFVVETRTDADGRFRANVAARLTYVVRLRFATQSGHADRDMGEIDASAVGEQAFVAPAAKD